MHSLVGEERSCRRQSWLRRHGVAVCFVALEFCKGKFVLSKGRNQSFVSQLLLVELEQFNKHCIPLDVRFIIVLTIIN